LLKLQLDALLYASLATLATTNPHTHLCAAPRFELAALLLLGWYPSNRCSSRNLLLFLWKLQRWQYGRGFALSQADRLPSSLVRSAALWASGNADIPKHVLFLLSSSSRHLSSHDALTVVTVFVSFLQNTTKLKIDRNTHLVPAKCHASCEISAIQESV